MAAPLIIAHRTAPSYAPENSIEGMRVSFEQGADGVEIDLRMSLDQRAFLMHDNSMWRTAGWPLPLELTPGFIARRRRLKGSSERVPELAAALEALPQNKLIAVDIKTPWAAMPLLLEVKQRAMASQTLVWCASALSVRYAVWSDPGWEVTYYKDYEDSESNRAFMEKARHLRAKAVSLDWRALDAELVTYAHELGLRVYSWHKEYELTEEKLSSGLDGLITDHPAKAREAITKHILD